MWQFKIFSFATVNGLNAGSKRVLVSFQRYGHARKNTQKNAHQKSYSNILSMHMVL